MMAAPWRSIKTGIPVGLNLPATAELPVKLP